MQFHTAKLFLFQVAFFERDLQQSPAMHLSILSEGLEGAKDFLDLYLWLPPKSEMALTNSEWIQLSFGVTQAAKFAIVSTSPAVEAQTREARSRLNIDHVFRHLILRIGALVGRADEKNKHKDIFYHYEQRTRKVKNWYEKMMVAVEKSYSDAQPTRMGTRIPYQQHSPHAQSHTTPSSYASSASPMQPSPMHAAPQPVSQGTLPNTLSYPQPLHDLSTQAEHVHSDVSQSISNPVYDAEVGMIPISSYTMYGNVPSIAFPDLMNAPGWDSLFTVPMEDTSWLVDVSQGYAGMNQSNSPSDGSWGRPGSL